MAVDATELHESIKAAMDGLCYDDDGFAELFLAVRAVVELHAPRLAAVPAHLEGAAVIRPPGQDVVYVNCAAPHCRYSSYPCETIRAVAGALGVEMPDE